MRAKKAIAVLMTTAMTVGMLAGCGGSDAAESSTAGESTKVESAAGSDAVETAGTEAAATTDTADLAGTEISFLNSKGEVQTALEDMAEVFEAETGIKVEVLACGAGESPYTKITSAYNSGTAPTMAMLDNTDIMALAEQYAVELSDQEWVKECVGQVMMVNGGIYSFPFCIEGRGLIYNKTAIEETLGTEFDAASINSYDALKGLLESLRAAGMENPVVISKEDWSLGSHQLGYIYDTYDGTTEGSAELINQIKDGSLKTADYERYNQFMDTLDLLLEYNINGDDPLGALYDQDPIFLADGEAAIWANGCWAWPNIAEAGASTDDEYGFIPFVLGNDTSDIANNGIQASATKQVMIDGEQASEQEIAAAKEFLNWLVYSEEGQRMLVEEAAIIPACSNNTNQPVDPLGQDIQARLASGEVYPSCYIAPGDHWSVLGASMQKYIAGESDRATLAGEIDAYWAAQE